MINVALRSMATSNSARRHPRIIQGGMGVAVSSWRLAQAVSKAGQLGVVSGTALDVVLARRLQLGDPGGHIAKALAHFPDQEIAERVWRRYFINGGKAPTAAFKSKPIPSVNPPQSLVELTVVGAFIEVWLAKQDHEGTVGINLLEKIQLPTIQTLYGAMLAGVDVVLMGAGIPRAIPAILDQLAAGQACDLRIEVSGGEPASTHFDPRPYHIGNLIRPNFYGIVASASLAQVLAKKCSPPADGFIIEGPTAGGHNAPPRGPLQLNEIGEPIYGERDLIDLAKFRELGLPFWLAGGFGSKERLQAALAEGAEGIQVGTAFAFCEESGITPEIKEEVIKASLGGTIHVFTDPKASPTGFPFKVVELAGTVSDRNVFSERCKVCDLGYLREAFRNSEGKVEYRCPGEPIKDYVRKGGDIANTVGRKCVCNGLLATVGLGQVHKGVSEPALVTAGDDVVNIAHFLPPGKMTYTAADVINSILD